MLCSRELRRQWLKLIVALQPKEKRASAWELVALLDENRVKLTVDGKFQPDWSIRPIPQSHIQLLVEHALMNTDLAAYRVYPTGYLEFLVQLCGYEQQRYIRMPVVPTGSRCKYDSIEEKASKKEYWMD